MEEKKLDKAYEFVWLELNLRLMEDEEVMQSRYAYVILRLLDSTFRMFSKGDNLKLIEAFEKFQKCLKLIIDRQKEENEIQRER